MENRSVISFKQYSIIKIKIDGVDMFDASSFLKLYNKTAIKKRSIPDWLKSLRGLDILPLKIRNTPKQTIDMKIPGKYVYIQKSAFVNFKIFVDILMWIDENMGIEFYDMYTKKLNSSKVEEDLKTKYDKVNKAYADLLKVYKILESNCKEFSKKLSEEENKYKNLLKERDEEIERLKKDCEDKNRLFKEIKQLSTTGIY